LISTPAALAGWNVSFDRTYRSRTMFSSAIGFGWESSLFVRLRPLPNGDVEYRDGSGEVWRFIKGGNGYTAPVALSLKLDATSSGWRMLDQKQRITTFDSLGRIASESDQFFDNAGDGNVINYFYDDHGRLGSVADPVGRISKLTYFDDCTNVADCIPGMLREIVDWRNRKVGFHYDGKGNLIAVDQPDRRTAVRTPASITPAATGRRFTTRTNPLAHHSRTLSTSPPISKRSRAG